MREGRECIVFRYLAHVRKWSKCDKTEKTAPVHSVVYLLNWSQLLREATLGQHRQQAPFSIILNMGNCRGMTFSRNTGGYKNSKAIHVTGHGGPYSCEMLRLKCFLGSHFTDGGEVVSLITSHHFIPRKILGTHFCYRLCRPQGHSAAGRIR
jgi:hypothetical protein